MDKKFLWIILILIFLVAGGYLIYVFWPKNNSTDSNLESSNQNLTQNVSYNNEVQNNVNEIPPKAKEPVETEVASATTNLSFSSEGRLTNIEITCSKLNGTTVEPGQEFSFNEKTGPSLASEGYEEAPVIIDGETVQAIGGGNCQVSSTLYNAVLEVSDLEVTERHPHGKDVGYVPEGKDATISYGSLDFKFVNNLDKAIKLYFENDDETITSRIVTID